MDGASVLGVLIGMSLVGLIPGFIAKNKGQSFFLFWLLGAFFFWPGFIAVLCVKNKKKELKRKETEVAGYEKLFHEGKITQDVYLEKRREILGSNQANCGTMQKNVAEKESVSRTVEEGTAKQTTQFDENSLFETARNSQNDQERRKAIIAIKNQSLLHEIVIKAGDKNFNIGLDTLVALRKVNDSDMRKSIAKKAKDWGMRARACMWLDDIEVLTEISKNDSNDSVREASKSRIRILGERKPIDSVPSFESLFLQIGLFARGETADGMCPYSYKSISIRDQFVAYGKDAAQVIKSYLMTCAAGREQYGWWNNCSPLVECITLSAGSSEADTLMLETWLIQLVNVQSNIAEYDRYVRRFAQIELDAIK